jgi:ABC-type nitrate/sulfonate/bicarbonate transport system substrate-binding protein
MAAPRRTKVFIRWICVPGVWTLFFHVRRSVTTAKLEKTKLRLGIIPLTDCAVIAVAKERGFFTKYGLDVTISREPSWASIRDKVMIGDLDAAHMLAPLPIACTLGLGTSPFPMMTAFSLGLNGNAITVSNALFEQIRKTDPVGAVAHPASARPLHAAIAARKHAGLPLLTFAMVFPFSVHNYYLRYWLAETGIHPDRDLKIIVVPPPRMAEELKAGAIDGFCVGEPWHQMAMTAGLGRVLITGYELWNNAPEKVLGVSQEWMQRHPNTHHAMICALIEAARWLESVEGRSIASEILSQPEYVGVPAEIIKVPLMGNYRYSIDGNTRALPDFHVFSRYAANMPWVSHGLWYLSQMYRWGQLTTPCDMMQVARSVYRPDLYRKAAAELGIATPADDMKFEGGHAQNWDLGGFPMGADRFFDGRRFDPSRPAAYLEGFPVHSLRLPLNQIDLSTS